MSTPQQPPHGNPNQPYVPEGYELAKKKKPFYQRLGCIIPLAIVLVIIVIIAVTSGGNGDNDGSATDGAEQTEFQVGETYTTGDGLDVTVTAFNASSDAVGTQLVCAEVTYANNGDEQASFQGYWDWKIQNPAGVITDPTFTGESTLDSGELASGGTVSGAVCFEGSEPGEYQLIYDPTLSFSSDTATWIATL